MTPAGGGGGGVFMEGNNFTASNESFERGRSFQLTMEGSLEDLSENLVSWTLDAPSHAVISLYGGGGDDNSRRYRRRCEKLQGVIVSVNYADFLAHTLPLAKPHFNKLVVVTSPDDLLTQNICEFHHVECVVTDAMTRGGAKFNKGAGITEGLKRLDWTNSWILHLDADIVLPPRFREILDKLPLDEDVIYGVDRQMCPDYGSWLYHVQNPLVQNGRSGFLRLTEFEIGARLIDLNNGGYLPIGFFQLFHTSSSEPEYPDANDGADHTDVVFAKTFAHDRRRMLPDFTVIHLQSGEDIFGANWQGRKTKQFGFSLV